MIQGIASSLSYYLFTMAGERMVMNLRHRLFLHILDLDVAFFDRNQTGDLSMMIYTSPKLALAMLVIIHPIGFCVAKFGKRIL